MGKSGDSGGLEQNSTRIERSNMTWRPFGSRRLRRLRGQPDLSTRRESLACGCGKSGPHLAALFGSARGTAEFLKAGGFARSPHTFWFPPDLRRSSPGWVLDQLGDLHSRAGYARARSPGAKSVAFGCDGQIIGRFKSR